MSEFNLNIRKLNKTIEDYKIIKNDFIEEINSSYETLKNTDAGWFDNNSVSFIETLKNDKYKINNYFADLNKLYFEIENFKDELNSICTRLGYQKNPSIFKYNESKINLVINKLNNVSKYLSNASYYIDLCNLENDFSQRIRVKQLKNYIKNMKAEINAIISRLNNTKKEINNILVEYEISIKKVSNFDLNTNLIEYNWHLKTPEYKKIVLEEPAKYSVENLENNE